MEMIEQAVIDDPDLEPDAVVILGDRRDRPTLLAATPVRGLVGIEPERHHRVEPTRATRCRIGVGETNQPA